MKGRRMLSEIKKIRTEIKNKTYEKVIEWLNFKTKKIYKRNKNEIRN
jgi:hypothetical protein